MSTTDSNIISWKIDKLNILNRKGNEMNRYLKEMTSLTLVTIFPTSNFQPHHPIKAEEPHLIRYKK